MEAVHSRLNWGHGSTGKRTFQAKEAAHTKSWEQEVAQRTRMGLGNP
jgi:hypothetical protein